MSYRVNSSNASSSRPICWYFANGHCRKGSSCHYLHTREGNNPHSRNRDDEPANYYSNTGESSSSTLHKSNSNSNHRRSNGGNSGRNTPTKNTVFRDSLENLPICKYFLEDRCRFGDLCWNKHEKPHNDNDGINTVDNQKNDLKNQKDKQKAKEVVPEEEYTCAICYDIPKVFGLLVHCDHIFCRDCIQSWRKTNNVSSPFQDIDTTKTCPVCRKNSPYFVPSRCFAKSGPQKEQVISTYREKISQIPCKYFKNNRKCPFADECFYKHANPDGSRCVLGAPRKKKTRYLSGIRYMDFSSEDFDYTTISEIIDGLQFNITDWEDDDGSWNDEDDDESPSHYIVSSDTRMEVIANDDDNVPQSQWESYSTEWSNSRGWGDSWDNDEEYAMDWRNTF